MFRLIATLLLTLLPAVSTYAQTCTTEWAAPTDGDWSDDANWTDGAPEADDTACITAPGVYTVTLDRRQALDGLVVGGPSGLQTLVMEGTLAPLGSGTIGARGRVELQNSEACGSCDGLPEITGILAVEGTLTHTALVGLVSQGGTLDVAPGGQLLVDTGINSVTIGERSGDTITTLRVRGRAAFSPGDGTANTARVRGVFELDGGTLAIDDGRLDISADGTLRDATFEVGAGGSVTLTSANSNGAAGDFTAEGTLSGDIEGTLTLGSGATLLAGPAGATLDVGGSGLRAASGSGNTVFFESAGGVFTNTNLVLVEGNGLWLRGVTLRNENTIEARSSIRMEQGSTLENTPTGVVALIQGSSLIRGTEGGQLVGTGQVVARLGTSSSATSRINVVVDLDGAVLASEGATLQLGEGTLRDVELQVPEGGAISFSSSNNSGSGQFTLVGTLSGTPAGTVTLANGGAFAAALEGATLDIGGTGLRVAPGSGRVAVLAGAGGVLTNVGLVRAEGNGATVRSGIIQNEGTVEVRETLYLDAGGVMRNTTAGQIQLIEGGGASSRDGSGRLENAGLIEALQGTSSNPTRSRLRGTLRSLPGSELRTGAGAALDLDAPASRSLPTDVRATGDGQFNLDLDFEIEGTLSPGTEAQPIDTLAVSSWLVFSRVAGSPQLVIDVGAGGVSDQIALARGTGPNFAARLAGTLVVRVRPGYTPQVGDTFEVIRVTNSTNDQFQGTFTRVVADGAPADIAFVAEKNDGGTALLVRAVEVAADGPITLSETDPIGGAIRPLFLTGPGVPGVTSARLECTTCLDPDGFGTIRADLVGEGTIKEARFDLTDPRAVGLYDLVLERPGLAAARVPITVRPYVSVAPMIPFIERGIRVRPEGGGFNPSSMTIYSFAGDFGPTYPFTRVFRPAPEVTALSLSTANPFSGSPQFFNDDARDEPEGAPILFLRAAAEASIPLSVNLRMDPSAVLFPEQTATGPDDPRYPFGEAIPGYVATLPNVSFERAARIIEEGLRGTNLPALQSYLATIDNLDDGLLRRSIGAAIVQRGRSYVGRPLGLIDQVIDVLDEEVEAPGGLAEAAARPFEEALDLALGAFALAQDLAHGEALVDGPPEVKALLDAERDALIARIDAQLGVEDAATATVPASAAPGSVPSLLRVGGPSWNPDVPIPDGPLCNSKLAGGLKAATVDPFARASKIYGGGGGGSSSSGGSNCNPPSGSADPNDKVAQSEFVCEFGTVVVDGEEETRCVRYFVPLAEATDPIDYAITFENLAIATEPAEFVTITDTLDANLNPATLEVLATSSDSTFSYTVEGQVVTFRFVGIDLPPNVSPPEGEGFVRFAVQPRSGLDEGTVIDNEASIVFDFNPPIETPVVRHELRAVADLAVGVSAPPEGILGETVTYVVQVANTQGDEASETQVVISLPDASLTSVTPSVGECMGTGPVVCDLGALGQTEGPEEAVQIEVVVQAEAKGDLRLTASATTSSFDGFLPNNSAAATVDVVRVGTEDEAGLPTEFTLDAVYPNPLARQATVRYGLPEAAMVEVTIYDLLGRRVAVLADEEQAAGWHEAAWEASSFASGVYLCQFRAGDVVETRKVTIVR